MNENKEYIESRFLEVLSICNMSRRSFCKYIGICETNFNRFVNNNFMYYNKIDKIEELGFRFCWIIFGEGERFNSRKNGILLNQKQIDLENKENYSKFNKITTWIHTHYNSIENFENQFNIKINDFLKKQDRNSPLPYELDAILTKEGFNIKWLYHLDESPYLTNKKEERREVGY